MTAPLPPIKVVGPRSFGELIIDDDAFQAEVDRRRLAELQADIAKARTSAVTKAVRRPVVDPLPEPPVELIDTDARPRWSTAGAMVLAEDEATARQRRRLLRTAAGGYAILAADPTTGCDRCSTKVLIVGVTVECHLW